MGTESTDRDLNISNWQALAYNQWVALPVSGSQPSARYKHAAAVIEEKLYVAGGNRNGRYLPDVQVFDLKKLVWSVLKLNAEPTGDKLEGTSSLELLPAISSHNMVKWGNRLLILGGNSRKPSDNVTVRFIDLDSHQCGVLETSGKVPAARGGQSATLVGSRLIMFGGEDINRHLLNDIHILDLETMKWKEIEAMQTPPAPRFDHAAAVNADRYLFIFGGSSHSTCFNDLHVLDLETMEWSQPQIQGDSMTPRAGHASITIRENWYIVGGGDSRSGAPETVVLDMSKLVWSVLTRVNERDPLASEGLSVCSATIDEEKHLIAFGGYNGKYNNQVFVMRPKLKETLRPKIFQSPAAAAAAASVTAAYALSKSELGSSKSDGSNPKIVTTYKLMLYSDIDTLREENQALESSVAEVRAENSRIRGKIDDINSTHGELSKELQSVQGQLLAERSRCSKLEAQIAELQKSVESLQSVEDEVERLRAQTSALEEDMEHAVKRQSSGMWGWIAGSPST